MNKGIKKLLVVAVVAAYVIAPDLIPGPVDDIIAMLIGAGVLGKQSWSRN